MSATLHADDVRTASRPEGAPSFARLAELVQRYLGCEVAVLSVDDPSPALRALHGSSRCERRASTAFRRDSTACGVDLRELTHPLAAGEAGMRFYAGLPLRDYNGDLIGILAAMDRHERTLGAEELETLKLLAGMASDLYENQRVAELA